MAAYAATIIALIMFVFFTLINLCALEYQRLLTFFLLPVVALIFSYVTILSIIERFIYRKIKVLYKTIHEHKSTSDVIYPNKDEDVLSEVEKEVTSWANEYSREIARLEELEVYRREYLGNVSHELKTPIFNIQGLILAC